MQKYDSMPSVSTDIEVEMFVSYQSQLYNLMSSMRTDLEVEMFVRYQ